MKGIEDLRSSVGKPKREFTPLVVPTEVQDSVRSFSEMRLREIFTDSSHDKISRDNAVNVVRTNVMEKVASDEPGVVAEAFNRVAKDIFRSVVFERDVRCDGRRLTQLRNISCSVDLYRPLHGSAVFQRGQTQVLCTVALDSPNAALKMDPVSVLTRYELGSF